MQAPLPFDSLNDNIVLSKNSIYNPFGIDFGGNSGVNPDFTLRTFLFGQRARATRRRTARTSTAACEAISSTRAGSGTTNAHLQPLAGARQHTAATTSPAS